MIRTVVVGVLRDGVSDEQVEAALQALRDLRMDGEPAGVDGIAVGRDVGLRPDAPEQASYALTVDFADDDSYVRYDLDEEHHRIRRELFAPITAQIRRIQFRLP